MQTSRPHQIERRAIAKISWRLLPLIIVIYLVAYIDRSNVAFAALTMNKDLGLTPYVYGWGAGIFFIGYALFEVPSNVMLDRAGARLWIARILITWGIISGLTAFAVGPVSFLVIRFFLGVAEAGFFPGMILYFTYWYPASYRGRVVSSMYFAVPVSNAIASIVSGAILGMDGFLGLRGWQWIFIIEALPAILLAFAVLALMTDRPAVANWLSDEEKNWLETRLGEERRAIESAGHMTLFQALRDARVLALCLVYLFSVTATYGITFFLPQIVKGLGTSDTATGFVSAIPYGIGLIGLFAWGYSSDRLQERRWHTITASLVGALGLFGAGWFGSSYWAVASLGLATAGIYGSRPCFWPMPSLFLTGTAAAGAIALINSIGNLGGYFGPFVVGWIRDSTKSFEAGMYFLAVCSAASAAITFLAARATRPPPAREQIGQPLVVE